MSDTSSLTTDRAGEYVVVARRYRPQTFADLVGQQHVAQALAGAIATNRVGHAYLFTGARGVGKTSSARILAKALDCVHGPTATPCNECDICRSISTGDDVDVLEIDGASNRGIDEMRQLRQNVNVRPSRARFKIYIIDEVHMLTKEAFNALLKTLEEPPEHVKFIFCTTEPEKIPITILSRCQRFDFAGIQTKSIAERLQQIVEAEGVEAEPAALGAIARRAAGSMRDSQSLLEQLLAFGGQKLTLDDVNRMLGTAGDRRLIELAGHLVARDAGGALADLDRALAEGADVGPLIDQLLGYFRDVMVTAAGGPAELMLYSSPSDLAAVESVGRQLGIETVLAVMQILDQTLARLRYSSHGRILAELALVRICRLADLESLSSLIGQLRDGAVGPSLPERSRPLSVDRSLRERNQGDAPTQVNVGSERSAQPLAEQADYQGERNQGGAPTQVNTGSERSAQPLASVDRSLRERNQGGAPTQVNVGSERSAQPLAEQADYQGERNQGDAPTQVNVGSERSVQPLAEQAGYQGERNQGEALGSAQNAQPLAEPADDKAKKKPLAAEPSDAAGQNAASSRLTAANGQALWEQVVEQLGDMLAEMARFAARIAIPAPNRLVASFPEKYTSCKSYCERPENLLKLEQALTRATGTRVRVEFGLVPDGPEAAEVRPSRPAATPQQRLLEKAEHPLVRRAAELFGAFPVRVEDAEACKG